MLNRNVKMYPVIELSKYKPVLKENVSRFGWPVSISDKEPYAIYFIYSDHGNFVVKGMNDECLVYIKKNFPKCIYRATFWNHHISRGIWASLLPISFAPIRIGKHNNRRKVEITIYKPNGQISQFTVRNVPHRWLPAYNEAGF